MPTSDRPARLDGKVALITGCGRGQGRVAAKLFAREGATVVGCELDPEAARETQDELRAGRLPVTIHGGVDLTDEAQVHRWVSEAVRAHGAVDVLYNNAGALRLGLFENLTTDDLAFTVDHELTTTWNACAAVWPHLKARGGGAIVNIASIAGVAGTFDYGLAAHSAAKGAVIALTRQLAAEGGPLGIRVNTVSPGVIMTPPLEAQLGELGDDHPFWAMVRTAIDRQPGTSEDVVYAGLYLASDEARWVTGQNLVVDGGATQLLRN